MPRVIIDLARCKGKGTCADVCPVSVFEIKAIKGKRKSVAVNEKDCIGCRSCEVQCPEKAIKVQD